MMQTTPQNHLIRCFKKGNSGENIMLIGCVHGNEKAGILISTRVLNEIFARSDMKNTLICIPSANPDGNLLNIRTNSNRIDINRNFPASNWVYIDSAKLKYDKKNYWGGIQPASETETKFILKIDSMYHPDAFIILHQFMNCVQYDGTGLDLASFISKRTRQKLLDNIGYKTEGSIGSYFGDNKRKEVVTIELPESPSDSLQMNLVNAIVDAVAKGYKNQ
jgi:protein MpaA